MCLSLSLIWIGINDVDKGVWETLQQHLQVRDKMLLLFIEWENLPWKLNQEIKSRFLESQNTQTKRINEKTQICSNKQINSAQLVSWSNSLSPQRQQLPDIQIILKWMIKSDPGRLVWVRLKNQEAENCRADPGLLYVVVSYDDPWTHRTCAGQSESATTHRAQTRAHTHAAKEHVNTKSTAHHTHTVTHTHTHTHTHTT